MAENTTNMDIMIAIARVEGKIDSINTLMAERKVATDEVLKDQEDRIRDLEKSRWKTHGIAAGIALVASGAVSAVAKALQLGVH